MDKKENIRSEYSFVFDLKSLFDAVPIHLKIVNGCGPVPSKIVNIHT